MPWLTKSMPRRQRIKTTHDMPIILYQVWREKFPRITGLYITMMGLGGKDINETIGSLVRTKSYIHTSTIGTSSFKEARRVGFAKKRVPHHSGNPAPVIAGDVLLKDGKYWLILICGRLQDVTSIFQGYTMRQ